MIFLSAQPDSNLFFWQLEILIANLSELSYSKDNIHVLIGFNPYTGTSPACRQFQEDYKNIASIYTYPDIRINKIYKPSIRPHIIKQHFALNSWLENDTLFYHDSDIVFTKAIDFTELEKGDKWYVSDTKAYLNAAYIKDCGEIILDEMCQIVGIDRKLIEAQNEQAGGAQYILKKVNYLFWDKVEKDSEALFKHLTESQTRYAQEFSQRTGLPSSQHRVIQAWCSDMWAVLWNGYFFDHEIEICKNMNFLWPTLAKHEWEDYYIYHDAGITKELSNLYFEKAKHQFSVPFHFTNDHVKEDSCSAVYTKLIKGLKKDKKYQMPDVTFLIVVRIDSADRLKNIICVLKYLNKYFDTNISVMEVDSSRKISPALLPGNVEYTFVKNEDVIFRRSEYNNILANRCKTPIIGIYDADIIISPDQIYKAVLGIRYRDADLISPYDGYFVDLAGDIQTEFFDNTDIAMLNSNAHKLPLISKYSWEGAMLVNHTVFKEMGGDNENLVGHGPEYYERIKRAEILGYKVKRQVGPLFHLRYATENSLSYYSHELEQSNKTEYLKVCNMTKSQLENYIKQIHQKDKLIQ